MNEHEMHPVNGLCAMSDDELQAEGGVAPIVIWGAIAATAAAIATFSDAVNGVYDLCSGWNNYEPTPHVTSTITYHL